MATGTDLSFIITSEKALDLYDLSGDGSKFFITVNGKYGASDTDFSCNMWPNTYSQYKIEAIKRETVALADSSFDYVSAVNDVSFDMSFVTGSLHSCTEFYVKQGDKNVSCLPAGVNDSHTLDYMIFYNLYDNVGGWYQKMKVEKPLPGLRLPTSFANKTFNGKSIKDSVKLSQDNMSVVWDNTPITGSSAPSVAFAVMIDTVFDGDFEKVVSLHQGYGVKIGVLIGQNIDKDDFEGLTGTSSSSTQNNDNAARSGWSGATNYITGSDQRPEGSSIKYLFFQAGGGSGWGTDIYDSNADYAADTTHTADVDNDTNWLGNLGYFGKNDTKVYLKFRRVGNTIRINQSVTSADTGYKSEEYIANVNQFKSGDQVCMTVTQYLYTWNAPITQFLKLEK